MSLPRFYIPFSLQINQETELPEVAAHHASRVLRMQPGDALVLFNGDGYEYVGEIVAINKKNTSAIVTAKQDINRESLLDVVLVQGISSGERMDYTIQKAVELGVNRIIPVISERSVVRFAGDRSEKRLRHWRQIIISACEQCGRNRLPEIVMPQTFQKWLDGRDVAGVSWIFVPGESGRLRDQPRPLGTVTILVGPEGGFSGHEIISAKNRGFSQLAFGSRVLRTETAAMAALAGMQALWGDC